MYHEHFGLARAPFRITPDTELFYPGGGRGEVLEALVYAVTSGEGIVKALALGADFVMLGRPLLYALGADGARGLATLIDILAEEIGTTMAQIGRTRIAAIDAGVLVDGPEQRAPGDAWPVWPDTRQSTGRLGGR